MEDNPFFKSDTDISKFEFFYEPEESTPANISSDPLTFKEAMSICVNVDTIAK